MSNLKEVGTESFKQEVLESKKPVIVDFWAEWCGPCRQLSPILDSMASEMDNVEFAKVNIDDYPEIANEYGITSIPAVYLFKAGEVAAVSIGAKPKHILVEEFKPYL